MWRNSDQTLRALPAARYIPNFVFLDSRGNKVFETRGFNNPREAKAIHEFVSRRLYASMTFAEFLATYPET